MMFTNFARTIGTTVLPRNAEVDVIYRNGHVRDFVVAEDLLQRLMDAASPWLSMVVNRKWWKHGGF